MIFRCKHLEKNCSISKVKTTKTTIFSLTYKYLPWEFWILTLIWSLTRFNYNGWANFFINSLQVNVLFVTSLMIDHACPVQYFSIVLTPELSVNSLNWLGVLNVLCKWKRNFFKINFILKGFFKKNIWVDLN